MKMNKIKLQILFYLRFCLICPIRNIDGSLLFSCLKRLLAHTIHTSYKVIAL